MKYSKNAKCDYVSNGISEENGWAKWYIKEKNVRKLRIAGIWAQAFLIAAVLAASRIFSEDIKAFGIPKLIGLLAVNVIILLLIAAPLREILHLLPVSKGRLGKNCIMSFRNYFSVYNGITNRTLILISLALPLIVFVLTFGIAAVLTSGIVRFIAVLLLAESCFICSADVYMFFFCIKNIGKNETVFGEYKKA